MSTRYSNSAKPSSLRAAGEHLLQETNQNYNYDGYMNDYAKGIQTKATGKLGANFFTEIPVVQSVDTTKQLLGLKKKMRHQQLEEQGYFINDKRQINRQNDEYQGKEVQVEIPVYEIFDPPNENYRKLFQPLNLKPIVGYYFNEQVLDQEDLYVEDEEKKRIQAMVEMELKKDRKKDYLLRRLNQNINDHDEKIKQEQRKQEMDQAVMRVVMGQGKKKVPETQPKNNKRDKSVEIRQKANQDVEWIQNQQKFGLGGKKTVIEQKTNKQPILEEQQIQQEQPREESMEKKNKHVTFGEDSVVEFNPKDIPKPRKHQPSQSPKKPTNWREKSNSFRDAIKAARGSSKEK